MSVEALLTSGTYGLTDLLPESDNHLVGGRPQLSKFGRGMYLRYVYVRTLHKGIVSVD